MLPSMASLTRSTTSRLPPVPLLLTPTQLHKLLTTSSSPPKLLDASWHMPNLQPPRSGTTEYLTGPRLPGALRWDVDTIATRGEAVRNLPHMMPDPSLFARACTKRGITSKEDHVVCYDSTGLFSSPRLAFAFVAMGHERVSVLDGGLPAWVDEGFEVEKGEEGLSERQRASATPEKEGSAAVAEGEGAYPTPSTLQPGFIRSFEQLRTSIAQAAQQQPQRPILDARPRPRYDGTAAEPRPGLKSGHMPGALSLPFNEVVEVVQTKGDRGEGKYTKLKDQVALYRALRSSITDGSGSTTKPGSGDPLLDFESLRHDSSSAAPAVTTTCGSGMTAAVLWLALRTLGVHADVYDESWMGWAGREKEGGGGGGASRRGRMRLLR